MYFIKKLFANIKEKYYTWLGYVLLFMTSSALADDDPFPKIDIQGGDIVQATGSHMESGMKYALVGGGVVMLLVGIGVIMHRLREDSTNKDTGSFLTTLITSGIAITVGIILIAIGWTAANYQIQS